MSVVDAAVHTPLGGGDNFHRSLDGVGHSLDQLLGVVRDDVLCVRNVGLEAAAWPTWLLFHRLFPIYSTREDSLQ